MKNRRDIVDRISLHTRRSNNVYGLDMLEVEDCTSSIKLVLIVPRLREEVDADAIRNLSGTLADFSLRKV